MLISQRGLFQSAVEKFAIRLHPATAMRARTPLLRNADVGTSVAPLVIEEFRDDTHYPHSRPDGLQPHR
jgi:hypothetical protein